MVREGGRVEVAYDNGGVSGRSGCVAMDEGMNVVKRGGADVVRGDVGV